MPEQPVPPQPGAPEDAPRLLPIEHFGTFILLGAIGCVLATIAFGWLARGIFSDQFVALDDGIITWLHGYWGQVADQVMLFFTTIGDFPALALLLSIITITLIRTGRWIDGFGLVLAGGGAGILNQILKQFFQRVRPDLVPSPFQLTSYSFPSGHSMGSIACYGMLAFIISRLLAHRWQRWLIVLLAAVIVFCVGLSRVYFGVHYPTDIMGGFLAGGVWLAISIGIVETAELYAWRRASRSDSAVPPQESHGVHI